MTLENIAQACGVSHITVSRALRGLSNVRPATARRICQYARQVGYQLPRRGPEKWLKEQDGRKLPFVLPYNEEPIRGKPVRRLFWDYVEGMLEAAATTRDRIEMIDLPPGADEATFVRELIDDGGFAGIFNMRLLPETITSLWESAVPMVTHPSISRHLDDYPGAFVYADRVYGYRRAWKYAHGKGHRRFGFLSYTSTPYRTQECRAAALLAEEPCELEVVHSFDLGLSPQERQVAIAKAFRGWNPREHPRFYFTTNDDLACEAIAALQSLGLEVPGDISIFGFDDAPTALYSQPQLTTLQDPRREIGRRMFFLLKEIIAGNPAAINRKEIIAMPVIERESVATLPVS